MMMRMASHSADRLPQSIQRALAGLRWRIRAYVLLEGISVALIWLGLTFWVALALDYLPVRLGADEMPRPARAVLLGVIAAVLALILYRWVLRRVFVRLADRSMAVLLERRHAQFRDSLITAVELKGKPERTSEHDPLMLAETEATALHRLSHLRLSSVFDGRPLLLSFVGAILLLATIGGALAADRHWNTAWMDLGFRRLYLLDDDPWPRQAAIEVVGVQIQREQDAQPADQLAELTEFLERRLKVARGSSLNLSVRANAAARHVPEVCTVYYRTAEGDRGQVNMTRVGRVRDDGFQYYRYDGKPLKGILTDLQFDVVGFDHRVRGYEIQVVDSPAVVEASLDCVFPDYMVDAQLSTWLPRTIPLTTATQLPLGTRFTLRAKTNKPLRQVLLRNTETDESKTLEPVADEFELDVSGLAGNLSLEATLLDADGVWSERPYRIYIVGVEDAAPTVNVRLHGIGTAVTPDVVIPVRGTVEDDYGIASTWFELAVNDGDARQVQFPLQAGGSVAASVDFREQRNLSDGLAVHADDQLNLTVKAADKYNLGESAQVGAGDHYQLDVVTPDRLLSMLEARELGLRRRFEQIKDEMTELRDTLVRVRNEGPDTAGANADRAEASTEEAEQDPAAAARALIERVWSLRFLRAQRGKLQSEKSAQELLGVAASFGDIREELINNRVDTEDRKQRIQEQIVAPLEAIGQAMCPELDRRLDALAQRLDVRVKDQATLVQEDPETISLADATVAQTDQILLAMDQVLQNMLDIEDYNELLDRVRNLIAEQEGLLDETRKAQKQQILDLLQ